MGTEQMENRWLPPLFRLIALDEEAGQAQPLGDGHLGDFADPPFRPFPSRSSGILQGFDNGGEHR